MTFLSKVSLLSALLLCATSIHAADAADAIGKVAAIKGFPTASGTGGARGLARGDALYEGDTVKASGGGNVQILLNDGTKLVVGPASQLVLERYLMRNQKTASKVAVKALRGYFRFITGNSAKSAYAIATPNATIGIRGTGFDIRVRNITLAAVTEGTIKLTGINADTVNAAAGCGVAEAGGGSTSAKLLEGRAKATRLRQDFPMLFNQSSLSPAFRLTTEECRQIVSGTRAGVPGGQGPTNTNVPSGGTLGDGRGGEGGNGGYGDNW